MLLGPSQHFSRKDTLKLAALEYDLAVDKHIFDAPRRFARLGNWGVIKGFKESKIASLLVLKQKDRSIVDSIFIPLDVELKENIELLMRVKVDSEVKEYLLGRVKLLNPELNIGKVVLGKGNINFENITLRFILYNAGIGMNGYLFSKGRVQEIDILLNNRIILQSSFEKISDGEIDEDMRRRGKFWQKIRFSTISRDFLFVKADPDGILDVKQSDKVGIIYLYLRTEEGKEIRVPFARWEEIDTTVSLGERRIQKPILKRYSEIQRI